MPSSTASPFWYVDHAAWLTHRQTITAAVPLPMSRPRVHAPTYDAVITAARRLGVMNGPGTLRIEAASTRPGLASNYLPYGPGDPLTPYLTVTLPDGAAVTVQGTDLSSLEDPDDRAMDVARDILFSAALDLTFALADHDPAVAAAYDAAVRHPQMLTVNDELVTALRIATPATWTSPDVFRFDVTTLDAVIAAALAAGALTLPVTVKSLSVRGSGRTHVGVALQLTDRVPDVASISFLADVADVAPTSVRGRTADALLTETLERFVTWFNADAWHQHAVLPGEYSA